MPIPTGTPIHTLFGATPTAAELLDACGRNPTKVCRVALEQTGSVGWAETIDFLVSKPLTILMIFLAAYLLNRFLRHGVNRFAARISGSVQDGRLRRMADRAPSVLLPTGEVNIRSAARARTLAQVLKSIGTVVIYTFAVIYSLGALGLNLGPLIAGAGIVGVAIGFGAQSLVRDFLSGIFILLEDQYGVGDVIDVGGTAGTVEEVSLRITSLRDVNGTVWHVPNGEVRKVGNKSQQWARAVLDLSLPFNADIEEAEALVRQVAQEVCDDPKVRPHVLEDPEVWGVEAITPDGITERLVVKTTPGGQFEVMRTLRAHLIKAFEEAGIDLSGGDGTVYVRRDLAQGQAEEAAAQAKAAASAVAAASAAAPKPK